MENLFRDLGYGVRMLRGNPGFSAVAIASMALGIGLNTTIFSVVNALLLRPPPIEAAGELVDVYSTSPTSIEHSTNSYPDYLDFIEESSVFSGMIGHSMMMASLTQEGRSELVFGEVVTGNYFDLLGIRPILGRAFLAEESRTPRSHPVVVLGHSFWQRHFGGSDQALGQTVRLNGIPYQVVGVAPESFTGILPGLSPELWVPAMMVDEIEPVGINDVEGTLAGDSRLEQRGRRWMFVKGRLRGGVRLEEARAQMATIAARLEEAYPESNQKRSVTLLPSTQVRFHPILDGMLGPVAFGLLSVVAIVLLIACANVANMLLAKASARAREIALRLAIGASRARLVRQLLAESLILSIAGGALGLLLASWITRVFLTHPTGLPISLTLDFGLDVRVLGFTFALAVATGVVFGLAPAVQASRTNLVVSLRATGDGKRGRRFGLGSSLVVGQVALSLVLLVIAGLLLRSLVASQRAELGFEPEGLGMIVLNVDMNGYDENRGKLFYGEAVERVRALPGVTSATIAERLPFGLNLNLRNLYRDGVERAPDEAGLNIDVTFIEPGYFDTMGIPLLRGRGISANDSQDAAGVVVVNETLADTFWRRGEDPIGHRLGDGAGRLFTVVGVAANHKVRTISEPPRPYAHFARAQHYNPYATIVFRTRGEPSPVVEEALQELSRMDASLVILDSGTMKAQMAVTLFPLRVGSALLGAFGALALALAALGLYGLIAYWVSQRRREMGIRMALGADRGQVMGIVLRRGMFLAVIGVGLGALAAALVTRVLSSSLYGVGSLDPLTFGLAALLLLAVALAANAVPARRASRVDPMVALRYE